ncbi:MAG: chemotaxis protein CheD [Desulfobacteraceae bacterium]|nr:chemotaxis protein CheD [Desulfobacteraceae bacterium]
MQILVEIGKIKVAAPPDILAAVGIGSCIALTLYDSTIKVGGMAHIMLPCMQTAYNKSKPNRFADAATKAIINQMEAKGALLQNIKAKIFGGANMFPNLFSDDSELAVGKRNILAVKKELELNQIEIIAQEVGGDIGRTVLFDTLEGSVLVEQALNSSRMY